MKTLIIFYHPHNKTINLEKDAFDPVMKAKDLKAFVELE